MSTYDKYPSLKYTILDITGETRATHAKSIPRRDWLFNGSEYLYIEKIKKHLNRLFLIGFKNDLTNNKD